MVVAAIMAIYVLLGTAMEELSMVLLTMPVFFPLIVHLGLDPVWFGIIIVCVVEIGLISPPVGHEHVRAEDPAARGADAAPCSAACCRSCGPTACASRILIAFPILSPLAAEPDEMKSNKHFIDRVSREMDEDLPLLEGRAPELLAACCRILAREGHESGLAGQVTARADKPGTWWTLQFGYGFEEATAERMVLVDEDLKPVAGGRPNPGVRFHIWIYDKRPDVKAIVHTHAPHASALAATGNGLKTIHMDSAMLHGTRAPARMAGRAGGRRRGPHHLRRARQCEDHPAREPRLACCRRQRRGSDLPRRVLRARRAHAAAAPWRPAASRK